MNEIDEILWHAVREALDLPLKIQVTRHAIIRYIERTLMKDLRRNVDIAWGITKNGFKVTDSQVLKYLWLHHQDIYDKALDDLKYFAQNKKTTFVEDGLKFVIKRGDLVTVMINH